ncbi:hypothetical protein IQ273_23835 [Nodosilinea sp. LEGE 07298]|uniref:hypothetical protein n=1 Tax=Nodosilinea sp. LEGE 07298 TaxID=2777970 RepID=UPI001881241D|nr:hypothetical protein [Nodosilinea sp. LEGE 07298]MBE9112429.1 hypothetical protein [Nodosilinea sp. LEGE 07298]
MDILIESTEKFEQDLNRLGHGEKAMVIEKINQCADIFPTQKSYVYRKLHRLPLFASLNGYESSLYTLKISKNLRAILTVDEDPIFDQAIFTLFRVVAHDDLVKAYQSIAESLYQEIAHHSPETASAL